MFFLTAFCSADRFRHKLRDMDYDALLRMQFEHHSLVSFAFVLFSFDIFHSEVLTFVILIRVIIWLPSWRSGAPWRL